MKTRTQSYFSKPKSVKHKVWNFGSLDDGTIINAYLLFSSNRGHLLYCASDYFYEGHIDRGVGSLVLCKKKNKLFECKSKNDRLFQCWRNIGEQGDEVEFVNGFIGKTNSQFHVTKKQLFALSKKLDAREAKIAKKLKREFDKRHL